MPVWFEVGWAVATAKNGLSAVELQSDYGLGSYETAWTMLHRYRRAMVFAERSKLAGYVEADEAYYGGRRAGKKGRSPGKTIVAIACEVHSSRSWGRIRLQAVPDASAKSLHFFLHDTVELGATVMTDHWSGYRGLHGFDHQPVSITNSPDPAHVVMPAVHHVASLLKRWLLGTHQGRVEPRQLQAYLDEFAFRFNRRRATKPGLLFHRLIEGSVAHDPVTYQTVAAGI